MKKITCIAVLKLNSVVETITGKVIYDQILLPNSEFVAIETKFLENN